MSTDKFFAKFAEPQSSMIKEKMANKGIGSKLL